MHLGASRHAQNKINYKLGISPIPTARNTKYAGKEKYQPLFGDAPVRVVKREYYSDKSDRDRTSDRDREWTREVDLRESDRSYGRTVDQEWPKGHPSQTRHCIYFRKGLCRFGDKCWDLHDDTAFSKKIYIRSRSPSPVAKKQRIDR
jgi:hypothetical protein